MTKFLKTTSAAILALAIGVVPAFAANTPAGTWQTVTGESRFEVTLCGDGTQVCAKLTWLRADAMTPENVAYLNTWVLNGAPRAMNNKWRGEAEYLGEIVKGTLTLVDGDTMTINGCKGALCQKFELVRL